MMTSVCIVRIVFSSFQSSCRW